MRVLGIETSCDETALAVVKKNDKGEFEIEKHLLASQVLVHEKFGGVVPEVAAREHIASIFPILDELGIEKDGHGIDAIAVTSGPGLVPALRIGVELGKVLSWVWKKPLVAVNHLEGHIYSVLINPTPKTQHPKPKFTALCLLVSGGHTELILMKDHGDYELIGMTRDDAAGEAFDKVAKLLGLGYPGGPVIAKSAEQGNPKAISFPRPMIDSDDFDFSFSGLKTAVKREMRSERTERSKMSERHNTADIAASFQQAVVETLVTKTMRAVEKYQPQSVILSGGVSANQLLRLSLKQVLYKQYPEISFHAPELFLTGDNAIMIAIAGAHHAMKNEFVDPLTLVADPNMRLV
ncbi:tRNA (adenosine(37)-N6)-threonylcarbamoyltransferase complex transferase subunit TsaD [Candidatus Uhrbacteria bacterium]|nr:tRNA (adenosine(37)-N6)-threonylcarbamoyltransferase complex transferase subunit TsaD [Candidatus Uhrbacteria bacterium]